MFYTYILQSEKSGRYYIGPIVRAVHVRSCGAKFPFWQYQNRHCRHTEAAHITEIIERNINPHRYLRFL